MGIILRDMTAQERSFYEEDGKKFPWLMTIHMTDDEFLSCIERDRGKGMSALLFNHLWNKHYSWVFLAVLKHFYETGEFVHYDWDYTDSQTEFIIMNIMEAWGADDDTINGVLDCKSKFDFSKHTIPSNIPPVDIQHYRDIGLDHIFKDYYEPHGFEYPFES